MNVCFITFGCQMNVADSDTLFTLLAGRGFTKCELVEDADLIVVNTCSVRAHAEQRARSRISTIAAQKKSTQKLWVIGCMAQRLGDTLKKQISGIDVVIGAKEIESLDQLVDKYVGESTDASTGPDVSGVSKFIAIMRGCDNYCSYCIVPFVRGSEYSIPAAALEEQIRQAADSWIKEIVLLGQNVNSYNDNGTDFPDLLARVASIGKIERVRFTTSHPKDCSEKLIRTMADTPKVCHHLHLPVQSGSDRVLELMNRKYTADHYRRLVDMMRKYIPHLDITTDILVGFPGETREDFNQTLSLVKDTQFTSAFMFAYSVREGTAAASMDDSVTRVEKIARLGELIEVQTAITKQKYDLLLGKTLQVLCTQRQEKKDRLWMGQNFGCKRVLVACDTVSAGMILQVRAVRSSGMTLVCEKE